jgi:hypothetical protein
MLHHLPDALPEALRVVVGLEGAGGLVELVGSYKHA